MNDRLARFLTYSAFYRHVPIAQRLDIHIARLTQDLSEMRRDRNDMEIEIRCIEEILLARKQELNELSE